MGAKTRKLSQINDSLIEWQSVVVTDGSTGLTAVAGRGYFINTTGGAITVTFPASPKIGDTIIINDYASTFATNNVTINFNGNKLEANTVNATLSTQDQTHTFVFTDATQGWKIVNQDTGSPIQALYISATGGTITTSGDFKIHTFTGDGCFAVSCAGSPLGSTTVDYLVVAGGGGGGWDRGGGGGAGGFREGKSSPAPSYTASPLVAPAGITVTATTFPISVGAGGSGSFTGPGVSGSNSVFSTITSAGGGGGEAAPVGTAFSGGSGGGASAPGTGGAGNTPPVSPSQGSPGGPSAPGDGGGGGGGATAAGVCGNSRTGGAGATTSISGSPTAYAGGGGGGYSDGGGTGIGGPGGTGGGGKGGDRPLCASTQSVAGSANTGGGGGGGANGPNANPITDGKAGGKGIVIIRYKFQ